MRRSIGVITAAAAAFAVLALLASAQGAPRVSPPGRRPVPSEQDDRPPAPGATTAPTWQPPLPPLASPGGPFQTPSPHAPQPPAGPAGPAHHPHRYALVDREISVLDDAGDWTTIGPLTLLLDSATGDVSYLVRDGQGLSWRTIPRPPSAPHHHPAGHAPGSWSPGPPAFPSPVNVPFPSTAPPTPAPSPLTPPVPPPPAPAPSPSNRANADTASPPGVANPLVDRSGFRESVSEAERLRADRRVGEAAFLALATPESVILDCRSREKFDRLHVRGAVNLPFPDITADELARLIPSPDTRVLIYCNNNFADAPAAFPEKVARAALNHHTFATLVAYGYRDVFELGPLVDPATTPIPLAGNDAR